MKGFVLREIIHAVANIHVNKMFIQQPIQQLNGHLAHFKWDNAEVISKNASLITGLYFISSNIHKRLLNSHYCINPIKYVQFPVSNSFDFREISIRLSDSSES